jgi:peptide-methionine (S)-S-oxide reductase
MNQLIRFFVMLSAALTLSNAHAASPAPTASAVFAGGCFWCLEADFEKLPGVLAAESGYAGGTVVNPTYEQVSAGNSGHIESVKIIYDPAKVSYATLLDYFWHHVDPTVQNRQFCDVGSQYRTAIFVENDAQRAAVEASKAAILKAGVVKKIYTETIPLTKFYLAEDYHQDYYKKNPIRYNYYRSGCGRDARVAEVWGTAKH